MATTSRNSKGFFDKSATHERRLVPYTGPKSYATGGDSLTPGELALGSIIAVENMVISNGSAIVWGWYNTTTQKITWYTATGTEVGAATDLSGYTGTLEVVGN